MKKIISLLCISAVLFAFSADAFAYEAVSESDYTFAGDRYSVSQIDTDGKIFVGVVENKIAVSSDFQDWKVLKGTDDVFAAEYLDGRFCAVNKGYTLVSEDGENWEKHENNLPSEIRSVIKNKNSVVAFVEDYDDNGDKFGTGTYQSFDGITWNKVQDIPEGATMRIINGKIFFASSVYMPGIYCSDTGESFEKIDIPGYEIGFGGMEMEYRGGEYMQWGNSYNEEDKTNSVYLSKDLKTWEAKNIPCPDILPHDSTYVSIGGRDYQLTINGNDLVWEDGEWKNGQFGNKMSSDRMNPPYTYYNITDYGILAWNTDKNAYFIDNSGNMTMFDGQSRRAYDIYTEDGIFYTINMWNEDGTAISSYRSKDGISWEKCSKTFLSDAYGRYDSASNGTVTIKSNTDIRGSWRDYEGNRELTGTVTDKNGNTSKVVFENTKGIDYVRMFGGDGWFIMNADNGGWYYSKDGITRGERITFPDHFTYLYSNGTNFLYRNFRGINYVGAMQQFANLYAPDTVRVKLNGEFLSFSEPPVIEQDRTLVSVRFLFERMGAVVDWNESARAVTITYGGNVVDIAIDGDTAYVNGSEKHLDSPARLINGKTMLPLRFISENLGFTVNYNDADKTAEILY